MGKDFALLLETNLENKLQRKLILLVVLPGGLVANLDPRTEPIIAATRHNVISRHAGMIHFFFLYQRRLRNEKLMKTSAQ